MKTILKFLLVITILSVIKLTGQGILIDHTSTDIDQIPINIVNEIKDNIKWEYAGLSHSNQILCGVLQAEEYNSIFNVEIGGEYYCCNKNLYSPPYLPDVQGALCLYSGCNGIRNLGWSASFTYNVQTTLTQNPAINVFQFCWCGEMETFTSAQLQEYFNVMQNLSIANPDVTFVYMTGNAQSSGDFGYNRYLRNQEIRQYCAANNKVLFDFADLDSWYNGEEAFYLYNDLQIQIQHSAYSGDECHHTNELNCFNKGKAAWWMMAKIRGWQATSAQSLNLKVLLQGNYSDPGMNTDLNSLGLLPLNQPFNSPPLNYTGIESVPTIPDANIVEWVLVELRDAPSAQLATSNTIVGQKAAFILSDGQIVDVDGYSNIAFNQSITEQLFIVVRHRNHLGIMSSYPLSVTNNIYSYDFTTGIEQAYGGTNSQIELSSGVWGMISGDGNLDGVIDNSDKTLTWTNNIGDAGYYSGDFTLNGNVSNQDKNLIWVINFGKTSYIP